jgi:hypothetical protein
MPAALASQAPQARPNPAQEFAGHLLAVHEAAVRGLDHVGVVVEFVADHLDDADIASLAVVQAHERHHLKHLVGRAARLRVVDAIAVLESHGLNIARHELYVENFEATERNKALLEEMENQLKLKRGEGVSRRNGSGDDARR